eukprot:3737708-Pleurochrysis_carterae.AAC.2
MALHGLCDRARPGQRGEGGGLLQLQHRRRGLLLLHADVAVAVDGVRPAAPFVARDRRRRRRRRRLDETRIDARELQLRSRLRGRRGGSQVHPRPESAATPFSLTGRGRRRRHTRLGKRREHNERNQRPLAPFVPLRTRCRCSWHRPTRSSSRSRTRTNARCT